MQSNASSLQIIYNLHVMLLLVNVMFSSEHSYFLWRAVHFTLKYVKTSYLSHTPC